MSKKKDHRRYSKKIPVGLALGFGAAVLGGGGKGETPTITHLMSGHLDDGLNQTCKNLIGWDFKDGSFDLGRIAIVPIIVGLGISMILGRFVNRRLSLPYVKL